MARFKDIPTWVWIAGGAALLLLGGGAAVVVPAMIADRRLRALYPKFKQYADVFGLPVTWPIAIARQETNFQPLVNLHDPGDVARGGSFGFMQISYKTATGELSYAGPGPQEMLDAKDAGQLIGLLDPDTNIYLGCRYLWILSGRVGAHLADVASAYNSGVNFARAQASAAAGNEGRRHTVDVYVPHVLGYDAGYRAQLANV